MMNVSKIIYNIYFCINYSKKFHIQFHDWTLTINCFWQECQWLLFYMYRFGGALCYVVWLRCTKPRGLVQRIALPRVAMRCVAEDLGPDSGASASRKLEDLIHLSELCVDLLQQNEEHHAEVRPSTKVAKRVKC